MSATNLNTPSYRLYRRTGQAVVTLSGKDHYLGKYDSPESREKYDRLVAEWVLSGRRPAIPTAATAAKRDYTIGELILAYLDHADSYYRKGGQPTSERRNIEMALRPLRRLYTHAQVEDFGPLALKTVRQAMIDSDLCRTEVNKRVRHIVRMARWGVENELVPAMVHHALKAVAGLKAGRSAARESKPVGPVPDPFVEAIEPYVSRQIWAMVELQRLTGMRSGEVTIMRSCDLDLSDRVAVYRPSTHKTEHHGRERLVYLGPRAQEILRPWLRTDLQAYLFSPAEAEAERHAEQRQNRRTPVPPSQQDRRIKRPRKAPSDRYSSDSYRRAITCACYRAGVPHWHPHQLRHSCATRLRKAFNLDTSSAVLGHATLSMTQRYAERSGEIAARAMEQCG
jgi:integrase